MSSSQPDRLAAVHRLDDYRTVLPAAARQAEDEVWAEILAAGDLFGALRDAGLHVRFDATDARTGPRVRVTDVEGRVVRDLAPSVVCDPAALEAELLSQDG
jgi:hypothetical protein